MTSEESSLNKEQDYDKKLKEMDRERKEKLKKESVFGRPLKIGEIGLVEYDDDTPIHNYPTTYQIIRDNGCFYLEQFVYCFLAWPDGEVETSDYTVTNDGKVTEEYYTPGWERLYEKSIKDLPESLRKALLGYSPPEIKARFEKILNSP